MQISPTKLAKIVFSGYLHSGKVDRDNGFNVGSTGTKKRVMRVGKKKMRKILNQLQGD